LLAAHFTQEALGFLSQLGEAEIPKVLVILKDQVR
jgi:hypothetical protein